MAEVHDEISAINNRTNATIQIITGVAMVLLNIEHKTVPATIIGWVLALIGFYCIYRGVQSIRRSTIPKK